MNTIEYLEAVKAKYREVTGKECSDYRASKLLGVTNSCVSNYRSGRGMDDYVGIRVAEYLGIEPAEVLADLHAEKSKDPRVAQVWRDLARQIGGAAAALMLGIGVGTLDAAQPFQTAPSVQQYILCQLREAEENARKSGHKLKKAA